MNDAAAPAAGASPPAMSASAALTEFAAPGHWQRIDFLSDLHLQASVPRTWAGFAQHLRETPADAVFLLGDIFEVWVGDDAADAPGFEHDALTLLREVAQHRFVAFMPGNRDFLLGTGGALAGAGSACLHDPCLLTAFGRTWLLSHGDSSCVDDVDYQKFRSHVRQPDWQAQFLRRPLADRRAFAQQARATSSARQALSNAHELWADLDAETVCSELQRTRTSVLIHGHTHRPAIHDLGNGLQRWVLSDWDLDHPSPRADVITLTAAGLTRLNVTQQLLTAPAGTAR